MTTTSGITSAAEYAGDSKSKQAMNKLADDMDTFLKMLTTQLEHQDPLSPMDSTEFTNQLVEFANVEQSIAQNENLETLIETTNSTITATAVSYIGKTVQAQGGDLPLQDGAAKFSYALEGDAASCVIAISDSAGNIVRSIEGNTTPGNHVTTWDGTDSDGNQLPDGAYSISVSALDYEGASVGVTPTTFGKVTTVASDNGTLYIGMDDVLTTMDNVIAVREYEQISFDDNNNSQDDNSSEGGEEGEEAA